MVTRVVLFVWGALRVGVSSEEEILPSLWEGLGEGL